ncbi:hypothetical protein [Halorientalis halophila]|uniref:hypothetical protein n=1 Tax=Halorientalis halophila TaxID=3108499 RepID=UPI00300A90B1
MKPPSIGRKPSERHFLWKPDEDHDTKRFDRNYFEKWCRHLGLDFETYSRVDHERAEESRTQYQCVFSTESGSGDSFSVGGEEWDIQTGESPRTFIEIDEEGVMRIQGWTTERILDVTELWHDGPELYVAAEGKEKPLRLDTRDLVD